MKKIVLSFFVILVNCYSQTDISMKEKLLAELKILETELDGDIAFVFVDPRDREEIFFNEEESFHAASTMKLAIMLELYKQVSLGKINLQDSILVKNEFKSLVDNSIYSLTSDDDSDYEIYSMIGRKLKLSELNYRMITMSSNLATNILIELLNPVKIMETMSSIGANKIQILRGVEDSKAFIQGLNNTTTAYDLFKILESIAIAKVVNYSLSKEMMDILFDQKHNDIIPELLPKNIKYAHKTGWISGVIHDAAICCLPNGDKYYLVILTKNLVSEIKAKRILQKISLKFYEYYTNKNKLRK